MAESDPNKKKMPLDIDYDMLFSTDDAVDDRPPELLITSARNSKGRRDVLQRHKRGKPNATLQKCVSLVELRNKIYVDKLKHSSTVNAFQEEFSFMNPSQGRNIKKNGQISGRGQSTQQLSSRQEPFQCPTYLVDKKKQRISKGDKNAGRYATSPPCQFYSNKPSSFFEACAPHDQPSTKMRPTHQSTHHLVDEEPLHSDTSQYSEQLGDCMKDVKVYYPSMDAQDSVEVNYTDMRCLAPEACLSSTIMNFYIRYLQQMTSSSENVICKYHFFNTYFYNKLQKLSYRADSFLKFRKWWKGVNIFEKAYILIPVHEKAHWSLGIICLPTKEDELGPIVLHLDSLGLHHSRSIFDNIRRFVKEEWRYLRNSEVPLDLPIKDEIWENLVCRMDDRTIPVPHQRNGYDCGLFVLYYIERFIKEAPERLREEDLSMFSKQWFRPEEASNLRARIRNLLIQEFTIAKEKETALSPTC